MEHDNPDSRPIHPDCALFSGGAQCTCDYQWGFWSGDDDELSDLSKTSARLEGRRRPVASSHGLEEIFDMVDSTDDDLDSNLDGFWKESEFLRTVEKNSESAPIQDKDLEESS